jgi:glycosyltransferase involved in cell wall biosynthesis
MQKILYIHQYFKTPSEPGGTRSYWFSKALIENGMAVTMIASRGKQKKLIEKETIEGIKVIYIRNAYSNDMSILRRFISFLNFMILSTWVAVRQKNIDLVYATSTPLTIGVPALFCKWFRGMPFVFEVRDLWPEVPIQMGAFKNKRIIKLTRWLEKVIYKNAKHIIALSPGMKEGIITVGIPEDKVSMIPNMSKVEKFYKRENNLEVANKFSIDINQFNVIHFGTMGRANGLEYIVHAAAMLKKNGINDVRFIFLGKGAIKKKLQDMAAGFKLNNLLFIDAQPMEVVSELVNLCDVSLVPFTNLPILQTNSPNKLFDSLSAGIPIIVNSAGWTKDLVEQYNCGVFVDPTNPGELAKKLIEWREQPHLLVEMGKNARRLAENEYDVSILSALYVSVIRNQLMHTFV